MLKLTPSQQKVFELFQETDHSLFITGQAGTGKSFLIKKLTQKLERKKFPVLATTGTAAVIINGRTFHSYFGLGILEGGIETTIEKAINNRQVQSRIKTLEGFVLDEVSMLSSEAFEAAETICRIIKKSDLPWGGVRLVLLGDFFQLPPISNDQNKKWIFHHSLWKKSMLIPIELKEMIRTQDTEYLSILNKIRYSQLDEEVISFLQSKIITEPIDETITRLCPFKREMNQFNQKRLSEIDEPLIEIKTAYTGNPQAVKQLIKQAPISETLHIKKYAKIMLRVNDPKFRYVNGSIGTLLDIEEDNLVIELKNGRIIDLKPTSFSWLNPNGEIIAEARNFPINLAYATTIHKSQGMTLDELVVNLKNLWETGQAYVALSRLKTGAGLWITQFSADSIKSDQSVIDFYQSMQNYH